MTRLLNPSWEWLVAGGLLIYYLLYSISRNSLSISENLKSRLIILPGDYLSHPDPINSHHWDHWKFAYVQYATDFIYLQLAVANFIQLREAAPLGDLVILYNQELDVDVDLNDLNKLKSSASNTNIILKPVLLIAGSHKDKSIWKYSFTKIHVFGLEDYDRVVYFDADSMLVNVTHLENNNWFHNEPQNLNELFFIPEQIDIALPQAYWLSTQTLSANDIEIPPCGISYQKDNIRSLLADKHKFDNRNNFFATHVMVIKPSKQIYSGLLQYINNPWYWHFVHRSRIYQYDDYDMEVINKFIDDDLSKAHQLKYGILDHRVYGVLTGEFREISHSRFISDPQYLPFINHDMGTNNKQCWDADTVLLKSKLIHFSDEPIPKPWKLESNLDHYNTFKIYCNKQVDYSKFYREYPVNQPRLIDDCTSVKVWNWIRTEFKRTRPEI